MKAWYKYTILQRKIKGSQGRLPKNPAERQSCSLLYSKKLKLAWWHDKKYGLGLELRFWCSFSAACLILEVI
jgi:hypothetical protein